MATLVLSTVGAIVGGPIGSAIGAVIGQQIDARIFAPKGRQGPRLDDLRVQTSSYGAAIPKLFGTMRVAGTVIWATDIREDRTTSGGGKKQPKTTTYSYSASFAVALSGRPMLDVRRIWADGKLLRGAAGDLKTPVLGYRLHYGGDGQPVDPLIASAEGIDAAPAYRGIAYAVFEGLQLGDFGNRIPSLTFEVVADYGDVTIAGIANALTGGRVAGATAAAVSGYAASGDSVRGALETLASAFPMTLVDTPGGPLLSDADPAAVAVAATELGSSAAGKRVARLERSQEAAGARPDEVALGYYEPARDYQAGLQRARTGGPGRRTEMIELPAALSAELARARAEATLQRLSSGRRQAVARLPWRRIATLRPGGIAALDDGSRWRIRGWTLERMVLELKLEALAIAASAMPPAEPGRATGGVDDPAGTTVVHLLDLPSIDEAPAVAPRLTVVAAGTGAGWRRADLSLSLDGGASWTSAGTTAAPAVIGASVTTLAPGQAMLVDRANLVEVQLLHDGMELAGCDDAALVAGGNAALLGDELIQFGSATPLGAARWRLGRLLRGRRGSEAAMAGHGAGERFVLLDPGTLASLEAPFGALGGTALVSALGPGDGGIAVTTSAALVGRALRPPPPVRLTARRLTDGTVRIGWTRRSRTGWSWLDGGDAPLGEESERYRLTLAPAVGTGRTVEIAAPAYDYSAAEQAADGSAGAGTIGLNVVQLGTLAASAAATATISL